MTPKEQLEALGIKVDGRWSEERAQQELDQVKQKTAAQPAQTTNQFETLEWANKRAAEIWNGQSSSLSLIERVARIRFALKEKGFARFDELVIPTTEDYKRYL